MFICIKSREYKIRSQVVTWTHVEMHSNARYKLTHLELSTYDWINQVSAMSEQGRSDE